MPGSSPMATLSEADVRRIVEDGLRALPLAGKRVLLVVPDGTRTAPIGMMFRLIHEAIGREVADLDVMIALGTHPPMSEAEIRARLEITEEERLGRYGRVRLLNHVWDDPAALVSLGTIPAAEIDALSEGLFSIDVEVTFSRPATTYDQLIIVGPVLPHEVVGLSGGSKYLFPGIGGPEILNFFHWLGAVITNPRIIGHKWTPVRRVIDRAAAMVPVPCHAFCLVTNDAGLAGAFFGSTNEAWSQAADLSARVHIERKAHPFQTVLSCAPLMYDDLWVGGKCMYKLEPVVADGGELIIYAPHIHEISPVHGPTIERIGYHVRDYFLRQWDRFRDEPWGILAHSTHVRGIGTYEDGVERPRISVTLATGIPEEVCRRVNLGYRDPATIRVSDFENREDEGILVVPHAGETLFRLEDPPAWSRTPETGTDHPSEPA